VGSEQRLLHRLRGSAMDESGHSREERAEHGVGVGGAPHGVGVVERPFDGGDAGFELVDVHIDDDERRKRANIISIRRMTSIVVDTNAGENLLHDTLKAVFPQVARARLDVGDVLVSAPSFGTLVVERKSYEDFVASLRDGRYKNQKVRLLAERERATAAGKQLRVVYLLECARVPAYDDATRGVPNAQPFAALVKMALRDNIAIIYSASAADSAKHLAYAIRAAETGGLDAGARVAADATAGYAGMVRYTNKRKNADDNVFSVMLASLTGVSGVKASAVAREYPTPAALVRAYTDRAAGGASEKQLDEMLADIRAGDKRLGPALSKRLRSAFLG